jgi:hypothetical protein
MEELRDLFTLRETSCDTHELLGCPCEGKGVLVERPEKTVEDGPGFVLASQFKTEKVCPFGVGVK